jgi:SAM-dependent methyltransferase
VEVHDLDREEAVIKLSPTFKSAIKRMPVVGALARELAYGVSTLTKLRGVHPRNCTVCAYRGRFRAHGSPPRWDARCPSCGSLERHRLPALLLRTQNELIRGRLIHFAPEPNVASFVKPLAQEYQSADLFMQGCDLSLNLEQIDLADASVDVFLVSHVLEHVDDRKALRELYRCLRSDGIAIIMVPIVEGWNKSYENDSVRTDRDRELHFGQFDHIRYYGADLRTRILSAGFALEEFTADPADCAAYGLTRGEAVFLARRPA